MVTVFIPQYVVGHWWENLLHNQSALRLKGRLLFEPGRDGDHGAVAAESHRRGERRWPQTAAGLAARRGG